MYIKNKLFFLIMLLCYSTLWAREVTIYVEDADLELPLERAVVRSWDGSDHTCDENGMAVITVPDDRQVTVQVSYPGYETNRLIIPISENNFTLGLRLGGAIESRELVIEAKRPGSSETRSGRSVAISGEALERSSQIGLIEDVMTSIKLLPGVGYSGMFNALPSIRGGDPGDLMATLDGFYIENPYHWGGGFSIFDPHMVSSAQLSHGIFSARYGHTISGLLEVSSKKASPDYAELEVGISTSAVNLNVALPLGSGTSRGGGLMLMGKVTYWDPFIWFLKELSNVWDNERLKMVNAVTKAPYIRSSAASFDYRLSSDLEFNATAFVGTDGVGADYLNEYSDNIVDYRMNMLFKWDNLQTFVITGLIFNPRPSMVLKGTAGAGYEKAIVDGNINYDHLWVKVTPSYTLHNDNLGINFVGTQSVANIQGRVDFDWSLGKNLLFAAGVQELFSQNISEQEGKFFLERKSAITGPYPPPPFSVIGPGEEFYFHYPFSGKLPEIRNRRFNSSAYMLAEYTNPDSGFGAELGLRLDHLSYLGKNFKVRTLPVFNPRLNLDFNALKNSGLIESLDFTAGTGLFSSVNDALAYIQPDSNINDYELKPNRSWTTVLGVKTDLAGGWSFNLEGYFKYVFDRAYQYMTLDPGGSQTLINYRFDGNGIVWGFDFMLQKFESRFWDGWLSYTFTHARYHEPERVSTEVDPSGAAKIEDSLWYYPYFHRFHNINLVLNFKPLKNFNIYTRLGLASGRPKPKVGEIRNYKVVLLDENGDIVMYNGAPLIINKYKRESAYSDDSRTTWSVPLDLKLSYTIVNPRSKVQTEMYLAAENLFSLIYVAKANTSFNTYTGTEDTGSDSANYEIPVPMASVGIKWTF